MFVNVGTAQAPIWHLIIYFAVNGAPPPPPAPQPPLDSGGNPVQYYSADVTALPDAWKLLAFMFSHDPDAIWTVGGQGVLTPGHSSEALHFAYTEG